MKDFRKTPEGLFICEECRHVFITKCGLMHHVTRTHKLKKKEYYDKWLKEKTDGLCKICGKETLFSVQYAHYKNCCSTICTNKYVHLRTVEETKKKYGVENVFQHPDIIKKIKKTNLDKSDEEKNITDLKRRNTCKQLYGCEYAFNNEKQKQTNVERYGAENPFGSKIVQDKIIKTNLERYNVEWPGCKDSPIRAKNEQKLFEEEGITNVWQRKDVIEKIKQTKINKSDEEKQKSKDKAKQTSLNHYGVEYPSQDPKILHKIFVKSVQIKPYKDTGLWYQGSNEFDFLEKHYERFESDLDRGPTIKYFFNDSNRIYFSDFIIKSLNLVIECKSSYLMKRDKEEIEAKKNATLAAGYNYIIIVDKDYTEFEELYM